MRRHESAIISARVSLEIQAIVKAEADRQGATVSTFLGGLITMFLGQDTNAYYEAVRMYGFDLARKLLEQAVLEAPQTYAEAVEAGYIRHAPIEGE